MKLNRYIHSFYNQLSSFEIFNFRLIGNRFKTWKAMQDLEFSEFAMGYVIKTKR